MPRRKSAKPQAKAQGRLSRGRTREDARFTAAPAVAGLPESYAATLQAIKTLLRGARVRAVLAANPIVLEAYWHIGKIILQRQREATWGAKVIDRLAVDLREAFPDMSGITARNLFSMRAFADAFPEGPIVKRLVSQLPWGHVIRLIQMVKDPDARDFYIRQALTHGWSRSILEMQIQNRLHLRAGKAVNNFAQTMPPADSEMNGSSAGVIWMPRTRTSWKSSAGSIRNCNRWPSLWIATDPFAKEGSIRGSRRSVSIGQCHEHQSHGPPNHSASRCRAERPVRRAPPA